MGDGFFTSRGKGLPSKYGARKVRQAERFRQSYGSRTPQHTTGGCAIMLLAMTGGLIVALGVIGYSVVSIVGGLI